MEMQARGLHLDVANDDSQERKQQWNTGTQGSLGRRRADSILDTNHLVAGHKNRVLRGLRTLRQ